MTDSLTTSQIAQRSMTFASVIHAHLYRPAFRIAFLLLATLLFVAGAWYSFNQLAISPEELQLRPLAILALLTLPSLFYGGLGLVLLARSSELSIPIGKATVISAYAYLAELLPLPGGAIVRTGALMRAGGHLRRSSALVILSAILWIALAMIGAGIALLPVDLRLSLPLLLIGSGASLIISAWLCRTASPALALQTLLHRISGILLVGLRLQFAFMALNVSTGLTDTLPFVLASLVGSASSIAPAGLGIGESLAALTATVTSFSPSTAFLAVAIDRIACLTACACTALLTRLIQLRAGVAVPAGIGKLG